MGFGANVRWCDGGSFRLATDNPIILERTGNGAEQLIVEALKGSGLALTGEVHQDISAVKHCKLLVNLNNSVNALTCLRLIEQLQNGSCRSIMAAAVEEGNAVYKAKGIKTVRIGPLIPAILPHLLRLPNWIYSRISVVAIDPEA